MKFWFYFGKNPKPTVNVYKTKGWRMFIKTRSSFIWGRFLTSLCLFMFVSLSCNQGMDLLLHESDGEFEHAFLTSEHLHQWNVRTDLDLSSVCLLDHSEILESLEMFLKQIQFWKTSVSIKFHFFQNIYSASIIASSSSSINETIWNF